jgi:sec-independent protein translocase protein TatA
MGTFSLWHWLVVGLVVLLLFGGGRISSAMGDVAKGIKAFRKGMAEDDTPAPAQPAAATPAQPAPITVQPAATQQAPRT